MVPKCRKTTNKMATKYLKIKIFRTGFNLKTLKRSRTVLMARKIGIRISKLKSTNLEICI